MHTYVLCKSRLMIVSHEAKKMGGLVTRSTHGRHHIPTTGVYRISNPKMEEPNVMDPEYQPLRVPFMCPHSKPSPWHPLTRLLNK